MDSMTLKLRHFLTGLLMLLATGASVAAPTLADEAPKRTLTLAATGAVKTAPDEVEISTGVTSEAGTAREALDKNSAAMTRVVEALKADGIEPADIQTTDVSVQPVYAEKKEGQTEQRIVGYRVTNSVLLILHDIGKLGQILDKVVSLGTNQIGAIEFGVAEPEALKDEARKLAMSNAIANAKLYAEAAGVELGPVLSISEEGGVYQPRFAAAPMAMEASKAVPIEAGTTTVEVRVQVSWELK
jgi:uncharacterized protein YggE